MATITSASKATKATKAPAKKVTKAVPPARELTITERLRNFKNSVQGIVVSGDIDSILTARQQIINLRKLVNSVTKEFDDSVSLANNGTNGEFLAYTNPDGEKLTVKTIIDRSPKNKNGKKVVVVETKYEL